MKKLILFCLFSTTMFSQTYFSPVAPTGLPYIVIINQISINGAAPETGTELAIFDDTLCVGATVLQDTTNNSIVSWQGNESLSLPGFTSGDSMIFFAYLPSVNKSVRLKSTYISGNGLFGTGSFSAVVLRYDDPSGLENESPGKNRVKVEIYPNPGNGEFKVKFTGSERGNCSVRIYSILGELLDELRIDISSDTFEYELKSCNNLSVGEYILRFDFEKSSSFNKIIIIR